MSSSHLARIPAAPGLRRWRGTRALAGLRARGPAAAAGPAVPGPPVLLLACALTGDRATSLPGAVLGLVSEPGRQVGTVVLDLGTGAGLDEAAREALGTLRGMLGRQGTGLRLVITSREERQALAAAAAGAIGLDAVHDSLRAAVLAVYAGLPGPGLVGAAVRAALAAPADTL